MLHDYKIFLESWTVRDAVNHLRSGKKFRLVLNEAVSKSRDNGKTRAPLLSLVGIVPDKILFELYEDYREV